jgi:hypothetical protein
LDQQNYRSSTVQPFSTNSPKDPHVSYYSTNPSPPDAWSRGASPDSAAQQGYRSHSGHPSEIWTPVPVEMEGALPVRAVYGTSPSAQNGEWPNSKQNNDGIAEQGQEEYVQHRWSDMNMRSHM